MIILPFFVIYSMVMKAPSLVVPITNTSSLNSNSNSTSNCSLCINNSSVFLPEPYFEERSCNNTAQKNAESVFSHAIFRNRMWGPRKMATMSRLSSFFIPNDILKLFHGFAFKGFTFAIVKSLLSLQSFGLGVRIPVTANFPVYPRLYQ